MNPILLPHVRTASDLVTFHKAVCEGFLLQALAKTQKADPYVQEVRRLWETLNNLCSIEDVVNCQGIQDDLLYAAGFSNKARTHLSDEELQQALRRVILYIKRRSGSRWREELVYRFLLTRGDTLGGSMRNLTGALAGKQFSEAVIRALNGRGIMYKERHNSSGKTQTLSWDSRLLLFDKTPRFIGNNVDVVLLTTEEVDLGLKERLERKEDYLACGELKGGIDPAGADEHWKTARSALERIRNSFVGQNIPHLFFVGAAIEQAMATEIFAQLQSGRLSYAANFTKSEQLEDLVSWLVRL